MCKLIIAIDGPAASGKSTVAKEVARRLGFDYLDTGAMYRCFTLFVLEKKLNPNDELAINKILKQAQILIKDQRFFLNGQDVSEKIRGNEVTTWVSKVCAYEAVREAMVEQQRKIVNQSSNSVILDGRDIGTYVFPNASLKIYLTASYDERAKRRFLENKARGLNLSLEFIKADLMRRDQADSTRHIAPLKIADDAIVLDNSELSIAQTADFIIEKIKELEND